MLFLKNEVQINKSNFGMIFFLSIGVSLTKISWILQKIKIFAKRDICLFCMKSINPKRYLYSKKQWHFIMSFLSETKICDLKETPTRLRYLSDHRGTPRKIRWGCAACFLKPLLYLGPKCLIFPSQFVTQPKIQNLVNFMT